jgi:toluene monooxygenase system protein D
MTSPPSSAGIDHGTRRDWVGPVLQAGPIAATVIAAIRELNPVVEIVDRGAYLRVLCQGRCRVTRAALERHRGAPFHLPVDLESVMSSFKGRLSMSEEEACWDA